LELNLSPQVVKAEHRDAREVRQDLQEYWFSLKNTPKALANFSPRVGAQRQPRGVGDLTRFRNGRIISDERTSL